MLVDRGGINRNSGFPEKKKENKRKEEEKKKKYWPHIKQRLSGWPSRAKFKPYRLSLGVCVRRRRRRSVLRVLIK